MDDLRMDERDLEAQGEVENPDSRSKTEPSEEARSLFDQLYKQYYQQVYNIALRYTKNHQDALDVSQETFIRVFLNIEKVDMSSNVAAWISTIAKNQALNFLRRNRRNLVPLNEALASEMIGEHLPRNRLSPEEHHFIHSLAQMIRRAMEKLSKKQKEIVELYYLEEMGVKEIAERMGISASTVRVHLHRATIGLRQMLGTALFVEEEKPAPEQEEKEKGQS